MKKNEMIIAFDFDGTCVTHELPLVGHDIGAVPIIKKLVERGHKLVLFTMRSDIKQPKSDDENITLKGGKYLTDAIDWFKTNKIPLYGIQTNPTQRSWTTSPKAYAQLYIDDAALGCPLKTDTTLSARPFVDWKAVEDLLILKGIL